MKLQHQTHCNPVPLTKEICMKTSQVRIGSFCLAACALMALLSAPATAGTVLFSDSFDRADSNTVGDNDNALGGTITQTWIEDGNTADVSGSNPDDAEDEAISGNNLRLDPTAGTSTNSTAWVVADHDFVDTAITDAGGFVLSYSLNPVVGGDGSSNLWGAVSFGHSSASAKGESSGDDGEFVVLNDDGAFGILIGDDATYQIFDDGSSLISGRGDLGNTPDGSEVYDVEITVLTTDFSAGQSATVSITVGGASIDLDEAAGDQFTRSFTWNTGANYINFEGHNAASDFDDVVIQAIPTPGALPAGLALLTLGVLRRRRG